MVLSMYREDLPDWVKDNWLTTCPECGAYICDNSDTGKTTARWCVNPRCPGHMSYKADRLAKYFHIDNFGPKTALTTIRTLKFTSHFQFLTRWFKDSKPILTLPEIAELACLEGYGRTQAQRDLSQYPSFTVYFATCQEVNPILRENKEFLIESEKYFQIKKPLSAKQMRVMGTGSFHGFSSRDDFFRAVNGVFGSYIHVIETGKRKTGISYLLKEPDAVDHSKSAIANECGIPIITPDQFLALLSSWYPEALEK